ncbi:hypothetical protein ACXEHT_004889 [Klebsiella variicola]
MSSGTLKLTSNSATVTGTAFKTDLATGDFIVTTTGGVTYTLGVKAIDSDTQVTLVRIFDGTTADKLAWQVIPRNVMVSITAQTHADVAQTMRGLLLDKKNWQAVFSESDSISVMLPDGTSYSGPSWRKSRRWRRPRTSVKSSRLLTR